MNELPRLSGDDILHMSFRLTRFREGYDPNEVDEFLDRVWAQMRSDQARIRELEGQVALLQSGEAGHPGFGGPTAF